MGRRKKIDLIEIDEGIKTEEKIEDKEIYKILEENYNTYSSYIASGRAACYKLDGFKTVYRRVLYSAFKNCRTSNIKSVSLDGRTLSSYHPHGSCYGTIVGLVEDGLLIGKGNFGSKMGSCIIPPAAPRYTEVRLNPISEVLFINPDLLPYVDWRLSDLGYDEPEYLPVLVPPIMTAINDTSPMDIGTGVHIKNQYPRFSVESLLKYAINYIKTGKFDKSLLEFKFMNLVKKFPTNGSYDDTDYKFSETFTVKYEEDEKSGVYITSQLPNFNMFSNLEGIPFKDYSKETTKIFIPIKYWDIKKFTNKVNFVSMAYTGKEDNVTIHKYSIQTAMSTIINNFRENIIPKYFEVEIKKLKNKINELEILLDIAEKIKVTKDLVKLYSTFNDEYLAIANKYSVSSMMKITQNDIDKVKKELNALIKRSKNIDKFILDLYENALNYIIKNKQ